MCLNQRCVDVSSVAQAQCGDCSMRGVSHLTVLLCQIIPVTYLYRKETAWWSVLHRTCNQVSVISSCVHRMSTGHSQKHVDKFSRKFSSG